MRPSAWKWRERLVGNASRPAVTWRSGAGGSWRLETPHLSAVVAAIGDDVFKAFCRCHVHVNRLVSIAQLMLLNYEKVRLDTVAGGRNARSLVWFAAGTLRELSLALQGLRAALAKRQWLDLDAKALETIREVEKHWQENPVHRSLRDQAAFHVDDSVVGRGVDLLAARGGPTLLAEGSGGADQDACFIFADEAVGVGIHPDTEVTRVALRNVHVDQRVTLVIQELFVAALRRAGVEVDEP